MGNPDGGLMAEFLSRGLSGDRFRDLCRRVRWISDAVGLGAVGYQKAWMKIASRAAELHPLQT